MNYLIIGSSDSGKSEYAENLLVSIAKDATKLYIATMIPYGEEGINRIKKHRAMREGKGFITIEQARDLGDIKNQIASYGKVSCILECLTNLVGNELYSGLYDDVNKYNGIDDADNTIIESVVVQINSIMNVADNLVIVTNDYDIEQSFDEETVRYCNLIKKTNDILKEIVNEIHIVSNGEWTIYENP